MPRLQIIIASTRPTRVGLPVGRWFHQIALDQAGFEIDLVDLKELDLPFMDEPKHPRFHDYAHQHTKDWSARVTAADAFVFVTPEYNHGMTAPLKNAIDFLHDEWLYKPVGFVSYGGTAAGIRSVEMLKQVTVTLKMTPLLEGVAIPFIAQRIDDADGFIADEPLEDAARIMLGELERWHAVLAPQRAAAARS